MEIANGEENMARIRKEGRKEGRLEIEATFRWTTPRAGRRASTRRREEFEKERPAGRYEIDTVY